MEHNMQLFNIVLLGGKQSQKTRLCKTLCGHHDRLNSYSVSVGIEFLHRQLQYQQQKVKLSIWDTSSQQIFLKPTFNLVKNCQFIIYVNEISSQQSLDDAKKWFDQINKAGYGNKPMMLVQYILDSNKRILPQGIGMKFAQKNGMMFQQIWDDWQIQRVDRTLKTIVTEIKLKDSRDKIDFYFNTEMDKGKCLREISNIHHNEVRRLNKIISSLQEKNASNKRTLQVQIRQLTEKNRQIQFLHHQAVQRLNLVQKIFYNSKKPDDIYDFVGLYEKDNLISRQMFKELQDQLKQSESKLKFRCKALEEICEHFDTITIHNVTAKLEQMSSAYNKYRLMHCYEESIEMAERQASQTSRLSNILQGLNTSSILEFD